jgi:hypothetical protein
MDIGRFMQKIKEFISIDDVTAVLEKLNSNNSTLKEISKDAPFVGGSIKVALHIIEKVYDAKIPLQKRLSLTLMRIMLESARDSLPYSVSNMKIEDVLGDRTNLEFEDIILELFDKKYNQGDIVDGENRAITYLPDHPVFTKFRNLLSNEIKIYNDKNTSNTINIPLFLTEFNANLLIRLEEEKNNNKYLENMLQKWKTDEDFQNLQLYLRNAKTPYLTPKKIDGKSLSEYYVENQASKVDKDTWNNAEENISKKMEWNLDSFLRGNNPIVVIAAPFGIGKSSLAMKIAHDCAIKFIENPVDSIAYIPVFVPLRSALEATCNDNSLENDLEGITSHSSRKEKTNILVILDGLDELPDDKPVNLHTIYHTIQGFMKRFPNRKFIITTRLEAGYPDKLNIKDNYIRLFSFNKEQIEQFFRIYGLGSEYHNLSNILTEQKLGKPLFCWMLATVYSKCTLEEREIFFDDSKAYNFGEIFLYQRFIHDIILGKLRDDVKRDFEKWYKESKDEKKALRLIAFLKNDKPSLSRAKVVDYLDSLNFVVPKSSVSVMSTYFSTSQDERGIEKFEFTHKSFKEYLLAEFYLESIFNRKYHRLIGNEPSQETYEHLYRLIKFVTNDDQKIRKYVENFVATFYEDAGEVKLKDFIKTLKSNSLEFAKQEDLFPYVSGKETQIWNFSPLQYNYLHRIWASRWIGIFIAGNLLNEARELPDEEFLGSSSFFIKNSASLIDNKFLASLNLSKISLISADLSRANLSRADLTFANLSRADLSRAILTDAILTDAILTDAILTDAIFPR